MAYGVQALVAVCGWQLMCDGGGQGSRSGVVVMWELITGQNVHRGRSGAAGYSLGSRCFAGRRLVFHQMTGD
jgi:hypothetical protein